MVSLLVLLQLIRIQGMIHAEESTLMTTKKNLIYEQNNHLSDAIKIGSFCLYIVYKVVHRYYQVW